VCRVQRIFEAVILFPFRIRHSQWFFGILSKSWLFAVLFQFGLFYKFFLTLFVFSVKKECPSLQGILVINISGLFLVWAICFYFFSEFRDTRGLYKVSSRVHAFCIYTTHVHMLVVGLSVACLCRIVFVEGKAVILSLDENYTSQVFESLS
jgi:hypothetical protein